MFNLVFRLFYKLLPSWSMVSKVPGISYVNNKVQHYRRKTNEQIENVREAAVRGGILILVAGIILWVAIFMYIAFYYTYIPSLAHTRPVHLQFQACENHEKSVCSFPTAHVQLTKRQNILMVGQSYKVYLQLDVPESSANKDLGMFMVCLHMNDKEGSLVANSCRTVMLHYRSWLLHTIRTLVFSPFLVFGSFEENQKLTVEMFSDFEEDQNRPVTDAYIEIQTTKLEVYGATMLVHAHFTGLRYLMFHWPVLSAVVGISTNLVFILMIASLSWYNLNQMDGGSLKYSSYIKSQFGSSADYFFSNEKSVDDNSESETDDEDNTDAADVKNIGVLEVDKRNSDSSTEC